MNNIQYKAFWHPGKEIAEKGQEVSITSQDSALKAAILMFQVFPNCMECRTERCAENGECYGMDIRWFRRKNVILGS